MGHRSEKGDEAWVRARRDGPGGECDGLGAPALLAIAILAAGATKVAGEPAMVQLFADIGAGQGLRLLIGATVTNLVIHRTNTLHSVVYALVALTILLLRRREPPLRRR